MIHPCWLVHAPSALWRRIEAKWIIQTKLNGAMQCHGTTCIFKTLSAVVQVNTCGSFILLTRCPLEFCLNQSGMCSWVIARMQPSLQVSFHCRCSLKIRKHNYSCFKLYNNHLSNYLPSCKRTQLCPPPTPCGYLLNRNMSFVCMPEGAVWLCSTPPADEHIPSFSVMVVWCFWLVHIFHPLLIYFLQFNIVPPPP